MAAIAVAAAVVSPYFIGQHVEQVVQQQVEQLNQQAGYRASITEYQGSWFKSSATIAVQFDIAQLDPAAAADMPEFPPLSINLAIKHGPVLFSSQGLIGLAAWQADMEADSLRKHLTWAEDQPLYQLTGVTSLFGSHSFSDEIPALRFQERQHSHIQFSGYQGGGEITSNRIYYQGHANNLVGEENGENRLTLKDLRIEMDADVSVSAMMEGGFYDSQTRLVLDQLAINVPGTDIGEVDAKGLAIEVQTTRNADKATGDMHIAYLAKELKVAGYQSSDLALEVQMQNLNEGVMMEYQKLARSGDMADPQAMMEFVEDNLPFALEDSPALNLSKLSGTLPMGKFSGYINSQIKVENVDDMFDGEWMRSDFWLNNLLVDAELTADKEVLLFVAKQQMLGQMQQAIDFGRLDKEQAEQIAEEQAPMMLEMIQQQGILVETEQGYQSNFSLKEGEALLNGEPMPLPL
ncbi:hypothetical protein GCM10010982_13290 [Bowmanella pacifica]|uniref:DUF945 domain-containing protein n=3 Tax=Bowmanella TaxID=366580 RepID=A0A917YUS8_9ALTE|nr:hypothetical protein GCM10010982_13290 [Bowmanella pacifica]